MYVTITGTGSYLPETILGNDIIARRAGVDEHWIVEKTGIYERHIAARNEATSDLATQAAEAAMASAGVTASDIDLLIVATVTPDQPIPATACFVQANIGADRAAAFDMAAACAGFSFALSTASSILTTNQNLQTALVVGAEIFSHCLDFTDRKTSMILGDGAGAVVLQKGFSSPGLLTTNMSTDGAMSHLAHIPAGGSRKPASKETLAAGEHHFRMQGREIRKIAFELLPGLVSQLTTSANIDLKCVKMIIPHQMNGVMLNEWERILSITSQVIYKTISWSGNTGAASIPIALDDAVRKRRISEGDILLLIAFGAGLTWGGAVLKWHNLRKGSPRHKGGSDLDHGRTNPDLTK